MIHRETLRIDTVRGRGTYEITRQVQQIAGRSGLAHGLCHLFIKHTSASLIVCENADRTVRTDLETFFARLVPDGDDRFIHDAEGPDDMPAHLRSILTQTSLSVPLVEGRCDLGTWQGIFVWEHRAEPHQRHVVVTIMGE